MKFLKGWDVLLTANDETVHGGDQDHETGREKFKRSFTISGDGQLLYTFCWYLTKLSTKPDETIWRGTSH